MMKKSLVVLVAFILMMRGTTSAYIFTTSDTAAKNTLEAIKTSMEMYAADNGFYPKNIKTLDALKAILANDFPENIRLDDSPFSLVAAATDELGTKYRIYSIVQGENRCLGMDESGKIVGPGVLADLITKLGPPLPENTTIRKSIITEEKKEKEKIPNEISFYKDEKVGVFKISVGSEELQGQDYSALIPVYENKKLFAVYGVGGKDAIQLELRKKYNIKFEESHKLVEKLNNFEPRVTRQKLETEKKSIKDLMEKVKKGETVLSEETVNENEKRLAIIETQIKDIENERKLIEDKKNKVNREFFELEGKIYSRESNTKQLPDKSTLYYVYGRFDKSGEVIIDLKNQNTGNVLKKIKMMLPEFSVGDKELLREWIIAQNYHLKRLSSVTSEEGVFSYVSKQSAKRFQPSDVTNYGFKQSDISQKVDLYSVTTGALAIQESLQLDRMTGKTGKKSGEEIPIEKLTGPQIKSHPFNEMLKGRKVETLPMDALVPEEFYYFHFSDINKEIEFSDLLDQWGTSLLNVMQVSSHDAQLKQKYLTQLCLELSVLTRLFGDKVIDDLAIVGNDPFLHEGTDVSVIFNVKNKLLFDMNVSKYIEEAKNKFSDVKESDFSYENHVIHAVVSPNRTVSSYSCYLDDFKIYSNSQKAIEEIIDTYLKKHSALADALDYQYMRTIFLVEKSQEDAFLYLSESCIRKLIGPQWKIARKRRMECNNSLCMINNAITMYHMEKNTEPPALGELLKNHYIEQEYLACPDGGNYSIDEKTGEPFCSKHGRLRYLIPITELKPLMASMTEQKEYVKFVEEYNKYWSRFFDPIGVRAKFDNNKIKVETCILPLIENSIYNGFKMLAGGNSVKINSPEAMGTIFQLFTKLNLTEETLKVYKADSLVGRTSFTMKQFLDMIGDNFSINAVDSNPMLSFDLAQGGPLLSGFLRDQTQVFAASFALSAITMPTYITISVKDEEKAAQFIHELIQSWAKENAYRRMGEGGGWFNVYGYQVFPDYKGYKIETLDLDLSVIKMQLHFMVYKNHLIIANQRNILTGIIDNPEKFTKAETNLMVRINPGAFDKMSESSGIGWQERMRKVCINNLGSIYALNKFRGIPFDKINEASLLVNGYFPYCPSGGKYEYDKDRDTIYCAIHGDIESPKQPFELGKEISLNKFILGLQHIESSLKFTPEGILTSVIIERNK